MSNAPMIYKTSTGLWQYAHGNNVILSSTNKKALLNMIFEFLYYPAKPAPEKFNEFLKEMRGIA